MPVRSRREKSLAAAQAACADWEPVLEGQISIEELAEPGEDLTLELEQEPS
jgi:hypothetical protein